MRRYELRQAERIHQGWAQYAELYVLVNAAQLGCVPFYATFTTGYELTLPSCRRALDRYAAIVRRNGHHFHAVWFAERYKEKAGYHAHALVASTATREELKVFWKVATKDPSKFGARSDIRKYYTGKGANTYAAKYITKQGYNTDYDIL